MYNSKSDNNAGYKGNYRFTALYSFFYVIISVETRTCMEDAPHKQIKEHIIVYMEMFSVWIS